MYTVNKLCELFLDKIDQEGNEIISTAQIMELLETETTSYIEEVYKYVENNQQLRDSILPLTKAYYLNALQNPSNSEEMIVSLPSDYLHLETADVIIPDVKVREVTIRRRGEVLANKNNPNQKPTDQYPTVIEYADTLAILGSSVAVGVKAKGFYISKPIYGVNKGDISVNLPDQTLSKLLLKMVTSFKERTGDPTFQPSYIQEQGFGQSNK